MSCFLAVESLGFSQCCPYYMCSSSAGWHCCSWLALSGFNRDTPTVDWSNAAKCHRGRLFWSLSLGGQRGGKQGARINVITDLKFKKCSSARGQCLLGSDSLWAGANVEGDQQWTTISPPAKGTQWNSWMCGWTGGRSRQPCLGLHAEGQDPSGGMHRLPARTPNASFSFYGSLYISWSLPCWYRMRAAQDFFRNKLFCTRFCCFNSGELSRQS